ncbi:MAG: HipA domain-containing protein [Atopobiaceae bacterium]|nr:HipA domain-containing protein [Atopobiaceae bacterium]
MLFFNYLMGASDAHAKNYSLLHLSANDTVLAPLYDVASGLPYDLTGNRPLRMEMSIGGENRLGHVSRGHVERFARLAGLDRQACLNLMANLCRRIVRSAGDVLSQARAEGLLGADELAERLLPRLESHCNRTLQQLG